MPNLSDRNLEIASESSVFSSGQNDDPKDSGSQKYYAAAEVKGNVVPLVDVDTREVVYVKRVDSKEFAATSKAANLPKGDYKHVVLPEINGTLEDLKPDLKDRVESKLKPHEAGDQGATIVVPSVPQKGVYLGFSTTTGMFMEALDGKKISEQELRGVADDLYRMNEAGVSHRDLVNNSSFSRDDSGQLRMHVIDFEPDTYAAGMEQHITDKAHPDVEEFSSVVGGLVDAGVTDLKPEVAESMTKFSVPDMISPELKAEITKKAEERSETPATPADNMSPEALKDLREAAAGMASAQVTRVDEGQPPGGNKNTPQVEKGNKERGHD